jgi:hypothetical protein
MMLMGAVDTAKIRNSPYFVRSCVEGSGMYEEKAYEPSPLPKPD